MWMLLIYTIGVTVIVTVLCHMYFRKRDISTVFAGKHVVITGGSQGMGFQLAMDLFKAGAKVTIMARTKSKLEDAKKQIEAFKASSPETSAIEFVSVDMTSGLDQVKIAMQKAVDQHMMPINCLIMSAGSANPGYFLEQDVNVFRKSMELNYLGPVTCCKAVVPMMIKDGQNGQSLVFISSAAASASFLGYSSYAPTKSALRSFSDALRNELRGFGISVHIAYPPDTDTPGFEKENETKPKETKEISPPEVYSAKSVSDGILDGLLRGEYHLGSPDIGQNFLISTSTNVTPKGRFAAIEILLSPVIFLIMLAFRFHADRISSRYGKAKLEELAKLQASKKD